VIPRLAKGDGGVRRRLAEQKPRERRLARR
jgi:hypothetical protein